MLAACAILVIGLASACPAAAEDSVDTALIVSVDVSGSVSEGRYQLQMQGIAKALEDPEVLGAITGGPHGGILFAMIAWADKPRLVVDWHRIATKADAAAVATLVRALPHQDGEFTCFGPMFESVAEDVIPGMPVAASRVVVDVSGDGIDNCTDLASLRADRDEVLKLHASINGLPILVPGENDYVGSGSYRAPGFGLRETSRDPDRDVTTLDRWYDKHVVGGPASFLMAAEGYGDFARALRRKFVIEISGLPAPLVASQR